MQRSASRLGGIALTLGTLIALGAAVPLGEQEQEPTFDPAANAKQQVTDATRLAAKKHRRVLVVWGSDVREADQDLYLALRRGKTKAWPFYYEYVITPIDQSAATAELASSLGVPARAEGAVLTILDAQGRPLANRSASEFRGSEGWNEGELGAFLAEHAVEPEDAEVVLKSALAEAERSNRRLFVHLGAPW